VSPRPTPGTGGRALREILIFGLAAGLLVAVLELSKYRLLLADRAVEAYAALVAVLFAAVGLWIGRTLRRRPEVVVREIEVPAPAEFVRDEAAAARLGVTPRELEILERIAAGLSNREIAEQLFVSENTVKTHVGRLFGKLGAARRTQAVRLGKAARLIP
jgi:DNA-binding CsgD family transcriptional regulator